MLKKHQFGSKLYVVFFFVTDHRENIQFCIFFSMFSLCRFRVFNTTSDIQGLLLVMTDVMLFFYPLTGYPIIRGVYQKDKGDCILQK